MFSDVSLVISMLYVWRTCQSHVNMSRTDEVLIFSPGLKLAGSVTVIFPVFKLVSNCT